MLTSVLTVYFRAVCVKFARADFSFSYGYFKMFHPVNPLLKFPQSIVALCIDLDPGGRRVPGIFQLGWHRQGAGAESGSMRPWLFVGAGSSRQCLVRGQIFA